MMKVTALYTVPDDVEAFEAHYLSQHAPMVDAIPGLLRQETSVGVGSPDGSPAAYYRQADLYFADMETLGAGFASDQGQATAADATALAERTGCTLTMVINKLDG
jgi:uncharacterized protein (TIGR02118 family)